MAEGSDIGRHYARNDEHGAAEYRVGVTSPTSGLETAQPPRGRAAILVAHGMGQQIPFQTLEDVAEGLRRIDRRRRGQELPKPTARTVALGDQRLQRLELTMCGADGVERDVHIYEAYWAPFTEGQVTLRDVTAFLVRAGIGGIVRGGKPFRRWLFGEYVRCGAPIRTVLYLVTALGVVLALGFLNALIVVLTAARAPLTEAPRWLSNVLFLDVTTTLNALVTVLVAFAVVLLVARFVRRPPLLRRILGACSVITFVAAIWATLASALLAAIVVAYHVGSSAGGRSTLFERLGWGTRAASFNDGVDWVLLRLLAAAAGMGVAWWAAKLGRELLFPTPGPKKARRRTAVVGVTFVGVFASLVWLIYRFATAAFASHGVWVDRWRFGASWPLVVLTAALVRRFLIQFVGDVAAYVQPQLLDRFYELRQKIKDAVWRTAHAIYASGEYEDVLLVGHSLGSVVVYDVLNRLLLDEELGLPGAAGAASRTRLLLTFGSPLDKTAFIFGAQGRGSEGREALAAAVQPLISDDSRRPPWVNVYSPWDIISGSLDYYDLPDKTNARPVVNEVDRDATTLLAAHMEYWASSRIFEIMAQHLV
jgi:hypothetical protein